MFLHELAERLHMTVQELTTGRPGMSAHELTIGWPCYFEVREREEKRAAKREESRRRRV